MTRRRYTEDYRLHFVLRPTIPFLHVNELSPFPIIKLLFLSANSSCTCTFYNNPDKQKIYGLKPRFKILVALFYGNPPLYS